MPVRSVFEVPAVFKNKLICSLICLQLSTVKCAVMFLFRMSKLTVIRDAKELQAGDHISWRINMLPSLLHHHAIVVAPQGGSRFKVIHVVIDRRDRPASSGSCALCGSGDPGSYRVAEQIVDFDKPMGNGELCRYNYEPSECYEPFEVIKNAKSKIGKFDYHALNNNCGHFARRYKTGNEGLAVSATILVEATSPSKATSF